MGEEKELVVSHNIEFTLLSRKKDYPSAGDEKSLVAP